MGEVGRQITDVALIANKVVEDVGRRRSRA